MRKWRSWIPLKRWKDFLSCFVVWRTDTLNPEHSGSPAAGASRSAKSQGVTQSFPGFVQTWQRVPGKHCRSHYLALWTVSPKYIFSHYSSILYLQSRDESPNQRMPVSRGIVMTHECTLPSLVRTVEPWSGLQLSAALPSSLQHHKTASGGKGRVLLIPASALSLTVMISMFLSLPLPSSFTSAHFISPSNHRLTRRRLTLGTQGWAAVTNGLKFLVYSSHGSLL